MNWKIFMILQLCDAIMAIAEDKSYWHNLGTSDLEEALHEEHKIVGTATNVIVFVGDGMGPTTITASRIYGHGVTGHLSFDRFPYMGKLKTYSTDQYVPDSCSTATALFCGIKTNAKTCGVDASVALNDCEASLNANARHPSVVRWAQEAGKSTGFVTTTRVTHATPAALYAHSASRKWECEARMPANASRCKDIARQLIEDEPGRDLRVIMGGGRQCLQSHVANSTADPIDTWACYSEDGRDLVRAWREDKARRNASHAVVTDNEELARLDVANTDFVLGIFANSHLRMNHARNRGPKGMPSLTTMTEKAIGVLAKNERGYLLVVEGGLIDFAHHRGHARKALDETLEFSRAIARAVELTAEQAKETLIVVTSDHSHSLKLSGYAKRDVHILDVAGKSKMEDNYFTSLLYATGGPNNYQYAAINGSVTRRNPKLDDTIDFEYSQQAAVLTDEVLHDGTDVDVHAKGPMAHLFHRVHEQTYVAHVIAYAAKIGPFRFNGTRNASANNFARLYVVVLAIVLILGRRIF